MNHSAELHGWKAICGYIGVSEKTARKYHDEKGLPVRKVGGRYRASRAELDRWIHARPGVALDSEPALDSADGGDSLPEGLAWYRSWLVPGLALVLVLVLVTALCLHVLLPKKLAVPASAEQRDGYLVALDVEGNELWRYPMPDVDSSAATPATAPLVRDVDGDGRVEVVFNYHLLPFRQEAGQLICFSDTGEVRWSFSYAAELTIGTEIFAPLYAGHHLYWLEARGEPLILAVLRHYTWYPTRLVLLEPATGQVQAEYWHPGFIEAVTFFDVDRDGVDELVVGGINNPGPGPGHASLAVLDIPFREPKVGLDNFFGGRNARERAYLLFPRVDYLAAQYRMQVVNELLRISDDRLRVKIRAGNQGELSYVLDRDLRLRDLRLADTLIQNHDAFYRGGGLSHAYHEGDLADWRTVLRLPTAPDGNSPALADAFDAARVSTTH